MTTIAVIIGILLAIGLLVLIVRMIGWSIKTNPEGTGWRGRVRNRRRPRTRVR